MSRSIPATFAGLLRAVGSAVGVALEYDRQFRAVARSIPPADPEARDLAMCTPWTYEQAEHVVKSWRATRGVIHDLSLDEYADTVMRATWAGADATDRRLTDFGVQASLDDEVHAPHREGGVMHRHTADGRIVPVLPRGE